MQAIQYNKIRKKKTYAREIVNISQLPAPLTTTMTRLAGVRTFSYFAVFPCSTHAANNGDFYYYYFCMRRAPRRLREGRRCCAPGINPLDRENGPVSVSSALY